MKKVIYKLRKKYNTSDPFLIAKGKNVIIHEAKLGEVQGYFTKSKRQKIILINEELGLYDKIFTCAHELGHSILHPDVVTPQLLKRNYNSELKLEREANEFATHLLINGSHEEYHITNKYDILNFYGIPQEMERFL